MYIWKMQILTLRDLFPENADLLVETIGINKVETLVHAT